MTFPRFCVRRGNVVSRGGMACISSELALTELWLASCFRDRQHPGKMKSRTTQGGPYPQTQAPAGLIHLGLGQPSPSLLPLRAFTEAAARRLQRELDPLLLQYGVAAGHLGFREALAEFLSARHGMPVHPDQLSASSGISGALAWVSAALARPGDTVVCEEPTYFLARGIFRDAGLRLHGVPVDDHGLCVDRLEDDLRAGLRPAFVYCIPSFHNPCSVTLAAARAERLVALAEEHDFHVVADEPYPLLHFGEHAPHCMMRYDRGRGRVVGLGSFSKLLGPGLRLGWVHAEPPVLARLAESGVLRSGGGWNPLGSAIAEELLRTGFMNEHLDHLRGTLRTRGLALAEALTRHFPTARFAQPRGGYFVWVDCGEGRDTAELLDAARDRHGVAYTPGARCRVAPGASSFVRLSFSFYEPDELEEGVLRLARALTSS